jgi:hypothetical protein
MIPLGAGIRTLSTRRTSAIQFDLDQVRSLQVDDRNNLAAIIKVLQAR